MEDSKNRLLLFFFPRSPFSMAGFYWVSAEGSAWPVLSVSALEKICWRNIAGQVDHWCHSSMRSTFNEFQYLKRKWSEMDICAVKLTGIKTDCVLHSNLTISKWRVKLDKILIIEKVEKSILVVSLFQNINVNFMSAKKAHQRLTEWW